jgi:hypothetical protein
VHAPALCYSGSHGNPSTPSGRITLIFFVFYKKKSSVNRKKKKL